jgi:hypothetical protein
MVRSGASPCREELSLQLFVFLTFDQFTRLDRVAGIEGYIRTYNTY